MNHDLPTRLRRIAAISCARPDEVEVLRQAAIVLTALRARVDHRVERAQSMNPLEIWMAYKASERLAHETEEQHMTRVYDAYVEAPWQ